MSQHTEDDFRDHIGTIDKEGKRIFLHPKKPNGRLYNQRKYVSYLLLLFLFSAPFIHINGNQLFLFNIIDRKFSLFGAPFWPQDFYLLVLILIIGIVGVTLFTVAFGRLFCGWICPQTIFMEMVFRRIDYWIEGDRTAQIKLDKQAWDAEKIRKRSFKYLLYFLISFAIANIFLAYIIGSDVVLDMVRKGPFHNSSTLIALLCFTGVFYFIYAWFREQVCIIACPYGRLQGVLLDDKSVVVAYDYVRGEGTSGRAKMVKKEDRKALGKGDCIDCKRCVHVCPTGIDIRNGTQLECINCTACIDECNHVMHSLEMQPNLITFASERGIKAKEPFKFTLRMKAYLGVLGALILLFVGLLFLRSDVEANILRLPGQLFEHKGANISNVFTFKLVNKTVVDYNEVTFKVANIPATVQIVGKEKMQIPSQGMSQGTLFIEIPQALLERDKTELIIEVYNGQVLIETTKTNFLSPRSFN